MRFADVNPKTRTPIKITATFGVLIAAIAAFVPLTEIVKLVNIGTLFAFIVVNIGVIVLRHTKPDLKRGTGCRSCRSSRSSGRCSAST